MEFAKAAKGIKCALNLESNNCINGQYIDDMVKK